MLLSAIIKEFEGRFLDRYQTAILPSHQKALWAMQKCRKASNHHMLARCTGCHKKVFIPHSCGHRSCPHCQNHEGWQWTENQIGKQLPAQYYLYTAMPVASISLAESEDRLCFDVSLCAGTVENIYAK